MHWLDGDECKVSRSRPDRGVVIQAAELLLNRNSIYIRSRHADHVAYDKSLPKCDVTVLAGERLVLRNTDLAVFVPANKVATFADGINTPLRTPAISYDDAYDFAVLSH